MVDFKKVKNILHLVVWIFSVVAGGLLADMACFGCLDSNMQNQFICAVVLGLIFMTTLLFAMLFFEEEVPEKSFYLLTIGAAILYITAGVFLVFNRNDNGWGHSDSDSTRLLVSGILSLANGAIFLFEFIAVLTKKDMLN